MSMGVDAFSESCEPRPSMTRKIEKVVFLMRGLPGSGKSTLAKDLAGEDGRIFSTDDFFMKDGEYHWDPKQVRTAHEWNQIRVAGAMSQNIPVIVVDNTNLQAWEREPYNKLAKENGYEIQVVHPVTGWAWDVSECAERNIHGVPRETLESMLQRASQDKEFSIPNRVLNIADEED